MPYIKQDDRRKLNLAPEVRSAKNCGELNYQITQLCIEYLQNNGYRYQQFNDITGVLENCKLEFYRRKTAPYEDLKIKENGDVY